MTDSSIESGQGKKQGFLDRNPWVAPAIIFVWLALLALGAVGEVFHVRWILDLPFFNGPR